MHPDRQLTRVDTICKYVDSMLLKNEDDFDRRCGYVHLYGVGLTAAFLALKRGHSREYAEIAEIAGLLHDYISYMSSEHGDEHAHKCVPIIREILTTTNEFSDTEVDMICQAVYSHSDKDKVDGELDEILKDADVMQHWLRNPMEEVFRDVDRTRALCKELSLSETVLKIR